LAQYIENDAIILVHGGIDFGDTKRSIIDNRNQFIKWFQDNNIIFFPQTIHYSNLSYVKEDENSMLFTRNLLLTFSNYESYTFATKHFPSINSLPSADMSFMIGNLEPAMEPTIDILILRRFGNDASFDNNTWNTAIFRYLKNTVKYRQFDWNKYKLSSSLREMGYYASDVTPIKMNSYLKIMRLRKLSLVNKIISQAKVIITDRLHASIFSLLIGRPHVMIDNEHNHISKTRDMAFKGKPYCINENLRSYYAKNPEDAIRKAVEIITLD
jgi:exopolysaccharide biosynthesis predicted pyruvyltransferase EpsI